MAEGFLGRWSQRKLAVRDGKPPEPAEPHGHGRPPAPPPPAAPVPVPPAAGTGTGTGEPQAPQTAQEQPPPPTMQDVAALHADSDFKPFVARAVAPEVRNAAMKKLFADPHFNVMDGLDIYIDDYSIADPLPLSMLRKMASAKFLKLFDEDDEKSAPQVSGVAADTAGVETTDRQSAAPTVIAQTEPPGTVPARPQPADGKDNPGKTESDKMDPAP